MTHSTSPATSEQRAAAVRLVDANALRFFTDERAGIIAVRDRVYTDPERQGLHWNTEDVLWYSMGYQDLGSWTITQEQRERAAIVCDRLNALAAPSIVPPETPEGRWIPHSAVCFFKDGDAWCAVFGDFINLQESPAGFGADFDTALADLKANHEKAVQR